MLYPILNIISPASIKTHLNLRKMYVISALTYSGTAWAPFKFRSHWRKLEAEKTIGIRLITSMPSYVRN